MGSSSEQMIHISQWDPHQTNAYNNNLTRKELILQSQLLRKDKQLT